MGDFYSNVSVYIVVWSCLFSQYNKEGRKGGGGLHNHHIRWGVSAAAIFLKNSKRKEQHHHHQDKKATLHQLAGTWKNNPTSNTLMMPSTMDYILSRFIDDEYMYV